MLTPLVVGRGTIAARPSVFTSDAVDVTIKRQIEIEAGLFAIANHIEAGVRLVIYGGNHGIALHFGDIIAPKIFQTLGGIFQPGREGIATDDTGTQWLLLHLLLSLARLCAI